MYESVLSTIKKMDPVENIGKIENIVGMSMEASGTGKSSIGDICMIYSDETESLCGDHVRCLCQKYKTAPSCTRRGFFEGKNY